MKNNNLNRRDFLKSTAIAAMSSSPLVALLGSFDSLKASDISGGYKALVVVLLEGGNDAFSMVVPSSDDAYAKYKAVREGVHLEKNTLLALNSPKTYNDGITYRMNEKMPEMKELFDNEKLAIIANVGTLVKPVTKAEVESGADVPFQLYAHNTQRALWLTGNGAMVENSGWAARAGDSFYPAPNPFFNITVEGVNSLQSGGRASAYPFRNKETVSPNTIETYGFGPKSGGSTVGKVYIELLEQNNDNKLHTAFTQASNTAIDLQDELKTDFGDTVADFPQFQGIGFPHAIGTPIEKQLHLVAKLIAKKDSFPDNPQRQIFFVNFHGWDTHAGQVGAHATLTEYLSKSLGAFNGAIEQLGLQNSVTTLTVSDFGRSLTSNGSGTDHGWGGHAFVMSGAVKGGDIYGKMPRVEKNSPDATQDRMIPTTSIEQYLSPIVKWFGASDSELNLIFPNRKNFVDKGKWFMA